MKQRNRMTIEELMEYPVDVLIVVARILREQQDEITNPRTRLHLRHRTLSADEDKIYKESAPMHCCPGHVISSRM